MTYFISSPKYQPMIQKILTETDQVCEGKQVGEGIFLKKFIKENLPMFESIELFIIDFTALADTDEELMQAIESLRIMDYRTRCILLAPYRKEGDKLLREFFYAGIYDIVISDEYLEMAEQLTYCIKSGMKYKDAVRYRDAKELEEQSGTAAVQKVLVGVAGAGDRAGCTHQSIVTARFLRDQRQMVALLELNPKDAFQAICETNRAKLFEDGYFTAAGIDYYPRCDKNRLTAIAGKLYNFIVIDFGAYDTADKILFNQCDVRMICAGVKPWELPGLEKIFQEQEEDVLKKYHFCFLCTSSAKLQKEILEHMEPLQNVWFPEYSEDPFQCSRFPEGKHIFADYLKTPEKETAQRKKQKRRLIWKK